MTRPAIRHFVSNRRSAVAVTMAIALVPLILLIGIAVDITFLSQARTQAAFASQAAAASATRIAAATYSLEVSQGTTSTVAAQQAINAANIAGNDWFLADLGNYVRGTVVSGPNTVTTYDGATTGAVNTSAPPNFSASVASSTSYPPIFDPIFGSSKNWVYTSGASATTQFSYAQILLMLDTSGSMMIGADSPADTLPMEQGTVCPANGTLAALNASAPIFPGTAALSTNYGTSGYSQPTTLTPTQPQGQNYLYNTPDGDNAKLSSTLNYPGKSDIDVSETCTGTKTGYSGNGTPGAPCALACHYSTTKSPVTGQYEDYYGLARSENVTLRIDVLFAATEQVIQDMESSQAVANQLSVGVYQFNTDVSKIVNSGTGSGGSLPEATSDLASALSQVNAVDWKKTPSETTIPQLIYGDTNNRAPNPNNAGEGGDTNFPLSLNDLEAGNAFPLSSSGAKQPLTVSGSGNTATAPQKFIFIVTDGMEDDSPNNGSSSGQNVEGEMTSVAGETAGTGACAYLKNTLKYTVYVLYVDYNPVSNISYYGFPGARPPNSYTLADYPNDTQQNTSVQNLSAVANGSSAPTFTNTPIANALQACASAKSDFYTASSSSDIQTALSNMLKSALASTIRLTN